ncbi:hypothetical protein [Parvibaculum sp.]|uniref:hypothetical protein n=1 Tax=Parvibaculum sp. TaxID=2024848 RepID=UPI001D8C8654|nr:hypothetical protein [Parvibaculum sp.]MBX3488863.1 hypothetical protein [Parvibaculum sp.]
MSKRQDVTIRLSAEGQAQLIASLRAVGGEGERMARQIERASVPPTRGLLAVNAASRQLQGNMQGLSGRAGVLGASLTALGPIGLGVAAALGAMALGIGKAFSIAREGMAFGDELDTASKRLKIGTEALQEYRAALTIFGDADADFDRGAKVLLERVGEANRGTGEGVILFRRLGIEIRNAKGELKGVDDLLPEIADKMQALGSEAERADVAGKLFGRGAGASFINLLQDGSEGLARMRGEMREAGLVMDAELVRRYAEASDQSEILTTAIGVHLKSAFASFPAGLNASLEFIKNFAERLAQIADGIRDIEDKTEAGLAAREQRLHRQMFAFVDALAKAERLEGLGIDPGFGGRSADIKARMAEVSAELRRIDDTRAGRVRDTGTGGGDDPGGDTRSAQQIANAERDAQVLARLRMEIENFGDARAKAIDGALARLSKDASPQLRAEIEQLAGTIHDLNEAEKVNAKIRAELDAIEKAGAATRKALMTDAEKLTERERELGEQLAHNAITAEEYARAMGQAREQYDESTRANKELSAGLARMSIDAISTGRAFTNLGDVGVEALQRLLNKMLEVLAFKPLEDAFSGFLSSTFSGVFHQGGEVGAAGPGRHVDPGVFFGAPRMHRGGSIGGLAPGEHPIIAQAGEKIFTPRQLDNADALFRSLAGAGGRGGGDVVFNLKVEPPAGTQAETRERRNASGGMDVEVMLRQIDGYLADGIAQQRSQTGDALERRYGLNPAAGLQR